MANKDGILLDPSDPNYELLQEQQKEQDSNQDNDGLFGSPPIETQQPKPKPADLPKPQPKPAEKPKQAVKDPSPLPYTQPPRKIEQKKAKPTTKPAKPALEATPKKFIKEPDIEKVLASKPKKAKTEGDPTEFDSIEIEISEPFINKKTGKVESKPFVTQLDFDQYKKMTKIYEDNPIGDAIKKYAEPTAKFISYMIPFWGTGVYAKEVIKDWDSYTNNEKKLHTAMLAGSIGLDVALLTGAKLIPKVISDKISKGTEKVLKATNIDGVLNKTQMSALTNWKPLRHQAIRDLPEYGIKEPFQQSLKTETVTSAKQLGKTAKTAKEGIKKLAEGIGDVVEEEKALKKAFDKITGKKYIVQPTGTQKVIKKVDVVSEEDILKGQTQKPTKPKKPTTKTDKENIDIFEDVIEEYKKITKQPKPKTPTPKTTTKPKPAVKPAVKPAEQPTQKEFKAVDIVDYAMSSQPIRVNDAFDSIIADKVISSLATRKQEVSAQMFNDKQETPAEVEVEVQAQSTEAEAQTTEA